MEEHEQPDNAILRRYCKVCAYWYHPEKGCDCDVQDSSKYLIEEIGVQ